MHCVSCFFNNDTQMELKRRCFVSPRFEIVLEKYRDEYIKELKGLKSISECNCNKANVFKNSSEYVKYSDDFLEDLQSKLEYIEKSFNEIIEIYYSFIKFDRSQALSKMDQFLNDKSTNYTSENAMSFTKLLFRGRPKEVNQERKYDEFDIFEYFHVPFNKRNFMSNQRFSLSGQPMIYCATSVTTVIRELEKNIDEINLALFLPNFSDFFNHGIYDIKNSIDSILNETIYNMILDDCQITYDNKCYTFSKNNSNKFIADSIFYQILTFPTQKKEGVFIEEYVLPQLMTDIIKKRNYMGISYQSAKKMSLEEKNMNSEDKDINYCFFVPYDKKNNYNLQLFNMFYSICIEKNDTIRTFSELEVLINEYKELINKCKEKYNMTDYKMYIRLIQRHIENMKNLVYNGEKYYNLNLGHVEITLLYKLIKKLMINLEDPENAGIVSWAEICSNT